MTSPRLILLPGLDGTGKLFAPFERALGSEVPRTIVSYSSPEVSAYAACREIAQKQLPTDESFILVGESFSGPIAITLAATKPTGLCGVVLVGSFASCPRPTLKRLGRLISVLPMQVAPAWLAEYFLLSRYATPEARGMLRHAIASVTPDIMKERLLEVARVDVSAELSRVTVPVLYLRANQDRVVPHSCGDEVARLAGVATILNVDAPHMLLQCAPAESAELIVSFARSCSSRPDQ